MSEVFTYTPGGAETLDQFNTRVAQFCRDNEVVDVVPSTGGETLMLSLTEPDDLPYEVPTLLQPFVLRAGVRDMPTLEVSLAALRPQLAKSLGLPVDELSILRTSLLSIPSSVQDSYIILIITVGMLEDDGKN